MLIDFAADPMGPVMLPHWPLNETYVKTSGAHLPVAVDRNSFALTPLRANTSKFSLSADNGEIYRVVRGFTLVEETCPAHDLAGHRTLWIIHFQQWERADSLRYRGRVRIFGFNHEGDLTVGDLRSRLDLYLGKTDVVPMSYGTFCVPRHK